MLFMMAQGLLQLDCSRLKEAFARGHWNKCWINFKTAYTHKKAADGKPGHYPFLPSFLILENSLFSLQSKPA